MSELSCDTPFIGQIGTLDLVRNHKGTVAGQHAHFEAMVQATAVLTCVCPKSGHFLRIVPRPRLVLQKRFHRI